MKCIAKITDKDILGTHGICDEKPRLTARAILKNEDNLYAVMYSGEFDFHSLPGGGFEGNEDALTALKREIREETGCGCDYVEELGYVEENRFHCGYTQISYYFVVTTKGNKLKPNFTNNERRNKTSVNWYTLDDAVNLISLPVYENVQRKFLQARDVAALNEYLKLQKQRGTDYVIKY